MDWLPDSSQVAGVCRGSLLTKEIQICSGMSASAKVSGVLIYYRGPRLALLYEGSFIRKSQDEKCHVGTKYSGYWGRIPSPAPLALIPPNKRALLSTGQALSSACSIFPESMEKFEGAFWDAVVEQLQTCRGIWVIRKPTTSANP